MNLTDPAHTAELAAAVAPVLVGSPFQAPTRWAHAVVILRADEKRVTSRGDFAHWLAANDLGRQARECTERKVKPGQVLVWLDVEVDDGAVADFVVCDLADAVRRAG